MTATGVSLPVSGGDAGTLVWFGDTKIPPEEYAGAERWVRKRANQHGHTRVTGDTGEPAGVCPDAGAHARDVAYLMDWLEALGIKPYVSGKRRTSSGRASRAGS